MPGAQLRIRVCSLQDCTFSAYTFLSVQFGENIVYPNHARLQRAGIPCPKVVLLRKHILIMSFIGHETIPAPKLKEAKLTPEQMNDAYKQCTEVGM